MIPIQLKQYLAYTRVSTTRQGEQGVSLQQQRQAIQAFAEANSLSVSDWFEEQETAARRGRPIWTEMLRRLRTGKATGVLIHKIDRSARNLRDWSDLGELIDRGVEIHFVNESLDMTSRGGRLSADIQAVVAADYVRNLREETKKGFYGRLQQGLFPMPAPVGYLNQGKAKAKTVDPNKAPLVKRAFELYATGTHTLETLTQYLFEIGLRGRSGRRISINGLSKLLNNCFYTGLITIAKTGQVFQGVHEPLISTGTFEEVKRILRTRLNTRVYKHTFLFRRLVKCDSCNRHLVGERHAHQVYYRCHSRTCSTSVRESLIERAVTAKLELLCFSPVEQDYLRDSFNAMNKDLTELCGKQLSQLKARQQQVEIRLNRLTDIYLDGQLERTFFEQKKTALFLERGGINERLAALGHHKTSPIKQLEQLVDLASNAHSLYLASDVERRRRIVRILSSKLTVEQKTPVFTLQTAFAEIANRNAFPVVRPSKGVGRNLRALLDRLVALPVGSFTHEIGVLTSF